jgi:hypothetical protein
MLRRSGLKRADCTIRARTLGEDIMIVGYIIIRGVCRP